MVIVIIVMVIGTHATGIVATGVSVTTTAIIVSAATAIIVPAAAIVAIVVGKSCWHMQRIRKRHLRC